MNKKIVFASTLICFGAVFRLIPHPSNFTPVAAMALLGGFYFSKKYLAFIVPIAALLISDLVLNNTINRVFFVDQTGPIIWADYMTYTYLAMFTTVLIGFALSKSSKVTKVAGGSLIASIVFFLVTNFGSWLSQPLYPNNLSGLFASYTAGIPFFANTLISNLLFVGLFVFTIEGAFKYTQKTIKA